MRLRCPATPRPFTPHPITRRRSMPHRSMRSQPCARWSAAIQPAGICAATVGLLRGADRPPMPRPGCRSPWPMRRRRAPPTIRSPPIPASSTRPMNPVYYRQMVDFSGRERPGTIVIDTPNKFLYLVQAGRPRDPLWHRRRTAGIFLVGGQGDFTQGRMARVDAALRDAGPPAGPAAPRGRWRGQSARRPRALSRLVALSDSRDERALHRSAPTSRPAVSG